ncbi:Cu(I)-responsive transcriptional regulator [Wenxinia marina]|uniref:Cu(I)-responsive transcriptional regulator n=1 Tax=Wenxinia marina DSM 24838 TaxID=1123501 RepID=A0A0D0QCV8_9RHOB|nr:Cu(I)-responsive transcriptional regulator [Wenxinia marina]KIQ70147.1 Cu(I)-responsive transcriptional regulator [Wenxinia marina DSM 24838]GGL80621.1 Cu(I)-responsive transcriptional regulator [Wenxinia marina]
MNIGDAARASGVNQKMIRYYESIGLIGDVARSANGYRTYTHNDIHTLAFVRRARRLGFSIEQIQALMTLWRDKERSSAEVKAIAQGHIDELQAKIEELAEMRRTLEHLVSCCAGDDRPDCPILDGLSANVDAASALAGVSPRGHP